MKPVFSLLASLPCLMIAPLVWADIYKCVDGSNITYTNARPAGGQKCSLLSKDQPVSSMPSLGARKPSVGAAPGTPAASGAFPRVDGDVQKGRDNDRRRILEQELAAEEKSLDQARQELSEQEKVRNGDERNYQKYLDRVQGFRDKVSLHERNIQAIRKELANVR